MDPAENFRTGARVAIPIVDAAHPSDVSSLNHSEVSQEIAQFAFGVSLKTIMKNLPVRDLLSCSLVSKEWEREARSMLRDERKCFASISGAHPCVKLLSLSNSISQMPILPFTGLRLYADECRCCYKRDKTNCIGLAHLHDQFSFILDEWPLKYLEIPDRYTDPSACVVMDEIARRLLLRNSGILEELLIENFPKKLDEHTELLFPKLKILQLGSNSLIKRHVLRNIQLIAPNLEVIRGDICIYDIIYDISPTQYFLVKELELKAFYRIEMEDKAVIMGTMSLETIKVKFGNPRAGPMDWELTRMLLENSRKSLKCLRIDYCSLLTLIRTGMTTPWKNLEALTLNCPPDISSSVQATHFRKLILSQAFPLSVLFPKLSTVELRGDVGWHRSCRYCCPSGYTATAYAKMDMVRVEEDSLVSHLSVRRLKDRDALTPLTFPYYSRRFPRIVEFESTPIAGWDDPCYCLHIWSTWPDLKRVTLNFICNTQDNFDGIFCGISEEEAAFLQHSSPEFLARVNIVPTKPAIYSLRGLEKISINILIRGCADLNSCKTQEYSDLFFLTKVSGYLAFRRMSGEISVNCDADNPGALRHLVPFVTVKYNLSGPIY